MQRNIHRFEELNVAVAAISVDPVEGAIQMASVVEASYPLLSDFNKDVAIAYGIFNVLGDGIAAPSVFIINSDQTIKWSYVGESPSDRPSAEEILKKIR